MRISTIQAFNNSVSGISRNYADLTRTQAEISAGKRLLTPADDPVGAVRLLQLNQEQALNGQYKSGITAAKNSLQQEETILNSVGTVIHRIREIAVQAGNGGLDSSDKNALATELAQREDELLNLLNSRDASGKYLFSGSQGDTQPFVRNPDGTYSYKGDEGQREVQIASSTFIAISDNGKVLFESGSNANRVSTGKDAAGLDSSGKPSGSGISLGLVTDKEAYDTVFPSSTPPQASDGVGIHFTDAKNYVVYDLKTIPPGYDWSTSDPNPPSFATLASGKIDDNPQSSDFIIFGVYGFNG
ncbi:Flagellar hook-associated protein FlgL [Pseudomonas paraeruginosa]|nr:Flagellar hook-associated protein FlgL [Pseudomonas aeruginosa]